MNNSVSRGAMFVTPTNPRFIDKAWTSGGDVYILDIEDSIAPAEKEVPDADSRIDTQGGEGRRVDLRQDQQALRRRRPAVCRWAGVTASCCRRPNPRRKCSTRTRSFRSSSGNAASRKAHRALADDRVGARRGEHP